MMTVTQAGSKGRNGKCVGWPLNSSIRCGIKSNKRNIPATMVIGSPASRSLSFFIMSFPPIRTASRAFFSLDGNRILPYNKFVNKQFVLFYCMIECLERQWIIPFACLLQNIFRDLYGRSCNGSTPTKNKNCYFFCI